MAKHLRCIPLTLKDANKFVNQYHRHSKNCRGHRFSIGAIYKDELVGVAIIGRPIARKLDQKLIAEVLRNCVKPTAPKGTCSFLYSKAIQVWQVLGGKKVITYTLETEPGSSLKAVNFNAAAKTGFFKGGWQNRDNRREYTPIRKIRWEKSL
jgi:hypothetical protein